MLKTAPIKKKVCNPSDRVTLKIMKIVHVQDAKKTGLQNTSYRVRSNPKYA